MRRRMTSRSDWKLKRADYVVTWLANMRVVEDKGGEMRRRRSFVAGGMRCAYHLKRG